MADDPIIVIGGGTAGTQAARALARAGRRVLVTDAGKFGGTCLWRGCVPKKALYTAADLHQELVRRGWLGLELREHPPGDCVVDWPRLQAWQREVMAAYAGDQEGVLRDLGVELLHERARFRSPDTVEIDGEPYRADQIVIATGSRGVLPDIPGRELMDTSDQALFYPEPPHSLVVVGGGYIAMELAGIYASFGTSVHLVVRGRRVLDPFEQECGQAALDGLQALGVMVHLETDVLTVKGRPGSLIVEASGPGGRHELIADRVLAATGRRAAVDDLDLAAGEVDVDAHGRPRLLPSLRSASNGRVWFAGDAAGGIALTPVASYEGGHIAANILGGADEPLDLSVVPSTCFTDPQVARVGLGEQELIDSGRPYRIALGGFASTAQAIIKDRRRGVVKLLADDEGRLLGAHIAGAEAAELIYGLALGLRAGITLEQIQATSAVHPSFAEAVNWTAFSVERAAAQGEQAA
jgi:glutathione reductase (NADPH)